jgi:hypothetical protein
MRTEVLGLECHEERYQLVRGLSCKSEVKKTCPNVNPGGLGEDDEKKEFGGGPRASGWGVNVVNIPLISLLIYNLAYFLSRLTKPSKRKSGGVKAGDSPQVVYSPVAGRARGNPGRAGDLVR